MEQEDLELDKLYSYYRFYLLFLLVLKATFRKFS
jgi:hypothetical protein